VTEERQNFVYVLHEGGESADKVLTALTLANIGVTMENDVTLLLMGEATRLAYKGYGETVHAVNRLPMSKLMGDFMENGGKVFICMPCIKARQVDPTMLIDGVTTTTGTTVNNLFLAADKVISW